MNNEIRRYESDNKKLWKIHHKASADERQMDIIVGDGEKIEIGIMSIPIGKATPATIDEIERKISEAFQQLQNHSNGDQEHALELHVGINEITCAKEVYLSGKDGERQLVMSCADYEE